MAAIGKAVVLKPSVNGRSRPTGDLQPPALCGVEPQAEHPSEPSERHNGVVRRILHNLLQAIFLKI